MSRILLLAPDLARNPVYTPWQFAGALRRLGHETRIAGPATGSFWPPLRNALDEATILGDGWVGRSGWNRARALADDAGMIYAFKAFPTSLGLGLALRSRTGVPLAVHLDDWDSGYMAEFSLVRRIGHGIRDLTDPRGYAWLRACEALVDRADEVTVSTRTLQRRFGGTVVRQGVDTDFFRPDRFPRDLARERLGMRPEEPMVLFLGTPTPHKGLGSLAGLGPEARAGLWLVGAGRDEWMEAGVDARILDAIRIRGPVPFDDAAWFMAASDVFVVPQGASSFAEHQVPAKLLQAMSLGCCVVASQVADAEEILGGVEPAGCLVPPDDPAALGAIVSGLLQDRQHRRRLGARARARAEADFGWDAMGSTLSRVLAEMGVGDG